MVIRSTSTKRAGKQARQEVAGWELCANLTAVCGEMYGSKIAGWIEILARFAVSGASDRASKFAAPAQDMPIKICAKKIKIRVWANTGLQWISSRLTSASVPWASTMQAQARAVVPMHALAACRATAAGGDAHMANSLFVEIGLDGGSQWRL